MKKGKLIQSPKIIKLVLIMMLNCRARNQFKRSSHSGDTLHKRINLVIRENFESKLT